MKTPLIISITFLFVSASFAQNTRALLKKEQAYRSYQFYILHLPFAEDSADQPEYSRMHYSDDEGFFYLNIPDSLIVIYLDSQGDVFRIGERFKVTEVKSETPLVLRMINDNQEEVIMRVANDRGMSFQFFFTESKVGTENGDNMMAYEFTNLQLIQ